MAMKRTFDIGTISEGTLKTEDIGANLIWHMEEIDLETNDLDAFHILKQEFSTAVDDPRYNCVGCDSHIEHVYDEIKAIADNYLPDYCYLGMNIGDGADFGVWPDDALFEDTTQGSYDGAVYRSTIETNSVEEHVPAEYSHYLAINDHGNCTLWARNGDTWKECWAIV